LNFEIDFVIAHISIIINLFAFYFGVGHTHTHTHTHRHNVPNANNTHSVHCYSQL